MLSISGTVYEGALTHFPISDSRNRMGRPPLNVKPTQVRLSADIRERIEAIVGPSKMAAFIREAVENELKRRERQKAPSDKGPPQT